MNQSDNNRQLRAEVRLLVAKQRISPITGVDDLSEETLQSVLDDYKLSRLQTVNRTITKGLVRGFTRRCKHTNIIPDDRVLRA